MKDIQNEVAYSAGSGGLNLYMDKGTAINQPFRAWESTYKLLLHGALGGVLSRMSSKGFSSGFVGATSNELLFCFS